MASVRIALITSLLVSAPRLVLACPVCFGETDAPLANAMKMGIGLMLAVVFGVMAAFATFFVSLVRRARLAETAAARAQTEPQEGTAQC
jgi:hypothetical protein